MPTVIKANTPADLLALVPHLVGYFPRNSLVMMMFDGKRTCGAIRIDIPTDTSTEVLKAFANVALGTVTNAEGVVALAPAIFTDEAFGDDSLIPHSELMDVLRRRIRHMGYQVREAICQASDGYGSYIHGRTPRGGHPLTDIAESPVSRAVPTDARAKPGDHLADAAPVPADPHAAPRTSEVIARLRTEELAMRLTGKLPADLVLLADIPLFTEDLLDWDDEEFALFAPVFLFAIQGPPMRDHIMLQWASDLQTGDRLYQAVHEANGDPSAMDESLGDIMLGKGRQPDAQRLTRGVALLRKLLTITEDQYRPAPLCMLAWLNWALGRLSHAHVYVEQALAINPDYGMAVLLNTIVESGMLPEWAFSRLISS